MFEHLVEQAAQQRARAIRRSPEPTIRLPGDDELRERLAARGSDAAFGRISR
jgi:hypothetical protein